jgi:hypothetical protein
MTLSDGAQVDGEDIGSGGVVVRWLLFGTWLLPGGRVEEGTTDNITWLTSDFICTADSLLAKSWGMVPTHERDLQAWRRVTFGRVSVEDLIDARLHSQYNLLLQVRIMLYSRSRSSLFRLLIKSLPVSCSSLR